MGGKEVKVRPRYALTWRIRDFVLLSSSVFSSSPPRPSSFACRSSLVASLLPLPPPIAKLPGRSCFSTLPHSHLYTARDPHEDYPPIASRVFARLTSVPACARAEGCARRM